MTDAGTTPDASTFLTALHALCHDNGAAMNMSGRCWLHTALIIMIATTLTRSCQKARLVTAFSAQSFAFCHAPTCRQHTLRRFSSSLDNNNESETPPPMTNLYREWTLEQDRFLWERRKESLPVLASLLGRGLRGVESRLAKLSDVDSPAYKRMFCGDDGKSIQQQESSKKLVPAGEVLRRIQYDYNLDEQDFTVIHFDRVDETLVESAMDAPNTSVAGSEEKYVFAIPEHRIMKVKYKGQVVWDRERRLDRVFGSYNGNGVTIDQVMEGYDEWKCERDVEIEWNRQRQQEVSSRIQQILGLERYDKLKELSSNLLHDNKDAVSIEQTYVAKYVQSCLQIFREIRNDPNSSIQPSWIPMTDNDALDTFSELAALLPDEKLRSAILVEIDSLSPSNKNQQPSLKKYVLPELNEDDLTETFVRGSGAGGQKINKTSNRVVLVHNPTQVKVECQETRSLQQNRKLARKRLRLKLDEHLNGRQSKESRLAEKRISKKSRAKARNRARQRKKQAAKALNGDSEEM